MANAGGVTPKGEALWAKVFEPDTKFDDEGVYSVQLVLDEGASQELMGKLKPLIDSAAEDAIEEASKKASPKVRKALKEVTINYPWEDELNEGGDETGSVIFKFKSKNKPKVYDAFRRQVKAEMNVGNGSIIRVAYGAAKKGWVMAATKMAGLTFYLNAIQVIELVEFGGGASGFEEEEGGFSSEGMEPETSEEESHGSGTGDF